MKLFEVLILTLFFAVVGSSSALAHRPYFTQVEKIRLPNGEIGEARLLNGDGILGPDPVRVIILDAQSRLLARSHKSHSMALSCRDKGQCLIFDLSAGKILELAPSSFRQGPLVPGLGDNERNELWELEEGSESWGFVLRNPSTGEMLLSYKVLMSSQWPMMMFNIVIGALCALLLAAAIVIMKEAIIVIKEKENSYFRILMTSLAMLIIAGMELFLALASGFLSLLGGLTFGSWLVSLCLGGVLVLACFQIRKQSRRRSA